MSADADIVLFLLLLKAVFVCLDHLLDHLAANGACLACSELAVITVLQVNADFTCRLHLELIHCLACCGNDKTIAGIVRHSFTSPFFKLGFHFFNP